MSKLVSKSQFPQNISLSFKTSFQFSLSLFLCATLISVCFVHMISNSLAFVCSDVVWLYVWYGTNPMKPAMKSSDVNWNLLTALVE